jgi:hypothetical protein
MGTNYYRIPTVEEVNSRKERLIDELHKMDLSPSSVESKFHFPIEDSWERESPWDKFIDGISVHLGKRSGGWKFCWNFHKNKYYSNKEELLKFIRDGRVVDEYGEEWNVEKFITMALEWEQSDGLVINEQYRRDQISKGHGMFWLDNEKYDDLIIDGLRVSESIDFS